MSENFVNRATQVSAVVAEIEKAKAALAEAQKQEAEARNRRNSAETRLGNLRIQFTKLVGAEVNAVDMMEVIRPKLSKPVTPDPQK